MSLSMPAAAIEDALTADLAAQAEQNPDAVPYVAGGVLTHWVAVSAWTRVDGVGPLAMVQIHCRDEQMPLWQLRGLLHEALRVCTEQEEA
ncbi:hypothetical protein ACG83_10765 [Frankia sp. R43]|uniref:hypothetical protein n=1 Tax=Frankia sp. R43 TaxID=269536 RepID=UPI0006C9F55B|nr:hypothetical protein [Frankia sp. R43]KPM55750.1 hypothetical protein ACG83_10765 [Frankia sp. R43]